MPGRIEIAHREERDGHFSFTLSVTHRLFGEMSGRSPSFMTMNSRALFPELLGETLP